MSPPILPSLHFQGKAGDSSNAGRFNPPPQPLFVPHELIFSAARLTIVGLTDGRRHYTYISITSPDESYINTVNTEVRDREPTTEGATILSRLFPEIKYNINVSSYGFNSGEDVSVTIVLLELESTAAAVTRDVLRDAESKLGVNAITFGISEAAFTRLMSNFFTEPELEVGTTPYLKLSLTLEKYNTPPWPFVRIDVCKKEFVITGKFLLTFFRAGDRSPVAVISTIVNVYCKPAMVTDADDTLQVQFRYAEAMEGSKCENIIDETGILSGYTSIPEFRKEVDGYLDQIISNKKNLPLGFALPAYLASRPMPDYWHHVLNMELNFRFFDYRTVNIHGLPISYLFIVFSMRSLDLPPPCYCEIDLAFLREANQPLAAIDSLPSQERLKRSISQHYLPGAGVKETAQNSLPKECDEVVPPRPDYYRIMTPAQITTLGLSQQSFREISRPISMGHDESTSSGGAVYWSARSWFSSRLEEAKITEDGIKVVIDVTAEGSARAAVRDKCGHDVLSASARLRIRWEDASIKWTLRINEMGKNLPELTIEAIPVADVGNCKVTFDGVLSPPPPLETFDDEILTAVANFLKPALNLVVSQKARIRLIRTTEDNGGIRLFFVDDEFFPGEAAVVLGQLTVAPD